MGNVDCARSSFMEREDMLINKNYGRISSVLQDQWLWFES